MIEKYTQRTYKELSKQTENKRAIILFDKLSMAGEAHALILTEIQDSLTKTGEIVKIITTSTQLQIPKMEDIPYDSGVKQTYYAMKKHLNLERDFKEIYAKLSEEVKNPMTQELFRLLTIDETNHHKQLKDLIKAFEETYKSLLWKTMITHWCISKGTYIDLNPANSIADNYVM